MAYEYFYPGMQNSLEPGYDGTGIYPGVAVGYPGMAATSSLGLTTDMRTAAQIEEVSNKLSTGAKVIEISALKPDVFDSMPKEQTKEINRQAKLVGAEVSVHGPAIEPSGFTEQGWSEENRKLAERQLSDTVIRAHEMNPEGEMPVTVHSSMIPGTKFVPIEAVEDLTPEEKIKYEETGKVPTIMVAVNQETGEFSALKREKLYRPEAPEGKIYTPEERIDMANNTKWINSITNLAFYKKEADEILKTAEAQLQPLYDKIEKGEKITADELAMYEGANQKLGKAYLFLDNVRMSFDNLYEEAAKYGDEDTREVLRQISDNWKKFSKKYDGKTMNASEFSQLLDDSMNLLRNIKNPPQIYQPVEKFAVEKASETFSNIALNAYNKFGEKAPIVTIENPPYGTAISTGEELKKLIEETREKFIEKAKKEGMSEHEAKRAAEKLIGATWDVGHINMIRKYGFEKEEIVKETEKIAPYVKHVHLSDNFGFEHTELPMGMGNVPIKEIMKRLGKEGYKGKKIIEAASWWQHFSKQGKFPPFVPTLQGLGSPTGIPNRYWPQVAGTYGHYFAFPSAYLPEQHFSMYGTGFSGLPQELGGQIPGKQSRATGTPMA